MNASRTAYLREYRKANREKLQQQERQRLMRMTPDGLAEYRARMTAKAAARRNANPEEYRRKSKESRKRHPEKNRARQAVRYAIKIGKLVRMPCAECGARDRVEAHHEDYSRPLDVIWLCKGCHENKHLCSQFNPEIPGWQPGKAGRPPKYERKAALMLPHLAPARDARRGGA